jgi:hypothetical protein
LGSSLGSKKEFEKKLLFTPKEIVDNSHWIEFLQNLFTTIVQNKNINNYTKSKINKIISFTKNWNQENISESEKEILSYMRCILLATNNNNQIHINLGNDHSTQKLFDNNDPIPEFILTFDDFISNFNLEKFLKQHFGGYSSINRANTEKYFQRMVAEYEKFNINKHIENTNNKIITKARI